MKRKTMFFLLLFSVLLTGCSFGDMTIGSGESSQSQSVMTSESTAASAADKTTRLSSVSAETTATTVESISLPEINYNPQMGEKLYMPNLAAKGVIYATIDSAAYYRNIHDAGIRYEDLCHEIQIGHDGYGPDYADRITGEVLSFDGVDYVFVMVHITVSNVNATTAFYYMNDAMQQLDPQLYADGFIGEYDFSANQFGLIIQKSTGYNAIYGSYGIGVQYFSEKGMLYDDANREFYYRLEPGETKSFAIGSFLPAACSTDVMIEKYGGEIGENLIPRYCVSTGANLSEPLIHLNLE